MANCGNFFLKLLFNFKNHHNALTPWGESLKRKALAVLVGCAGFAITSGALLALGRWGWVWSPPQLRHRLLVLECPRAYLAGWNSLMDSVTSQANKPQIPASHSPVLGTLASLMTRGSRGKTRRRTLRRMCQEHRSLMGWEPTGAPHLGPAFLHSDHAL